MSEISVGSGIALGFGGTNARWAECSGGDINGFSSIETPSSPDEFFGWMAKAALDAGYDGHRWLVAGFPGPVSSEGTLVGPLVNVRGMAARQYDLRAELIKADSAIKSLFDTDFEIFAVNDGNLAAQAAAYLVGEHQYDRTAALIVGTGVGAGVVVKVPEYEDVHRTDDQHPYEIGHLLLGERLPETFETKYAGPAQEEYYEMSTKEMPEGHVAWARTGLAIGRMGTILGLMAGTDLVVPCGGVGAGAANRYQKYLEEFLQDYEITANKTQRLLLPKITPAPAALVDEFEMYGAEGVIRDYRTREE